MGTLNTCVSGERATLDCLSDEDCPGGFCFSETICLESWRGELEGPEDPHPGACNGGRGVGLGGEEPTPPGTSALANGISFSLLFDGGSCCSVGVDSGCEDPVGEKGADGVPCTDDDPDLGEIANVPATTNMGRVFVMNADDIPGKTIGPGEICGEEPCITEIQGEPFDCDALQANPTAAMETGLYGLGLTIIDNEGIGDSVATIFLGAASPCPGDCNRDERVGIGELLLSIKRALEPEERSYCGAADPNNDGSVDGEELRAAAEAIFGCS